MSFGCSVVLLCLGCTALAACGNGDRGEMPSASNLLGLVLSGGAAKGAYEVGVWQELQTAGLAAHITAISGTSIGAINAALFATNPESVERIWRENMKDVFAVNKKAVGRDLQELMNTASNSVEIARETGDSRKAWAHFILSAAAQAGSRYAGATHGDVDSEGYIDSAHLAKALNANIPLRWPDNTPAVYATALVKGGENEITTWRLNSESHERRILMLRASAALPGAFDTIRIDGKVYIDGGWERRGGDNIPLRPILDNHPDIKTVIVVYLLDEEHLNHDRRAKNREAAVAKGVRLVEIIPTKDISGKFGLGGLVDTRSETARDLVDLGRKDAEKVLKREGLWSKMNHQ